MPGSDPDKRKAPPGRTRTGPFFPHSLEVRRWRSRACRAACGDDGRRRGARTGGSSAAPGRGSRPSTTRCRPRSWSWCSSSTRTRSRSRWSRSTRSKPLEPKLEEPPVAPELVELEPLLADDAEDAEDEALLPDEAELPLLPELPEEPELPDDPEEPLLPELPLEL